GRVYFGQLDGKVVALDQQTGKVLWKKALVQWQLGQTITAAPIYVDGKIYIGVVGAEYGTRSSLSAMAAATGRPTWPWYLPAAPDLKTGKVKWYCQQVHHDIWDYDSASPAVLFDAGGHKGIAQAGKTGWLYMLDRATGKPLYGITEKPVPQNAAQKSWPTQPI